MKILVVDDNSEDRTIYMDGRLTARNVDGGVEFRIEV
jgi:hypothetical protein